MKSVKFDLLRVQGILDNFLFLTVMGSRVNEKTFEAENLNAPLLKVKNELAANILVNISEQTLDQVWGQIQDHVKSLPDRSLKSRRDLVEYGLKSDVDNVVFLSANIDVRFKVNSRISNRIGTLIKYDIFETTQEILG